MSVIKQQISHIVLIVAAAAIVGAAVNMFRPDPIPWSQDWEETLAARAKATAPKQIAVIELAQMTGLYQQPNVVVVDARPTDFYLMGHVPGAVSLPLIDADRLMPEVLKKIPKDKKIVTYCEDPTCPSAMELAKKISASGRGDVSVYLAGIVEWRSKRMPMKTGEE